MALPRESTFLPTITCSSCGDYVQISMMGEHLCHAMPTPESSPPLEGVAKFENPYAVAGPYALRNGTNTPPLSDTTTSNDRFYAQQRPITPVSQPLSRSTSPQIFDDKYGRGRTDAYQQPPKVPVQRDDSHSPRSNPRRPGGYGGFTTAQEDSSAGNESNIAPPPSGDRYGSFGAAAKPSQEDLRSRNGSNAAPGAGYGGFNVPRNNQDGVNSRNASNASPAASGYGGYGGLGPVQNYQDNDKSRNGSNASRGGGGYGGFGAARDDKPAATTTTTTTESRFASNGSSNRVDDFMTRMNNMETPKPLNVGRKQSDARNVYPQRKESLDKWDPPADEDFQAAKPARQNGYGGFGAVVAAAVAANNSNNSSEPAKPMTRAGTFPKLGDHLEPARRPSAPAPRSPRHFQADMGNEIERPSTSQGPDTTRRPPPRTSLIPQHKASGSLDLAAEFGIGNPYHASSSSNSSEFSSHSDTSNASNNSNISNSSNTSNSTNNSNVSADWSPVRSKTIQTIRKPSDAYNGVQAMHAPPPPPRDNVRPADLRVEDRRMQGGPGPNLRFDRSPLNDRFGAGVMPNPNNGPREHAPRMANFGGSLPRDQATGASPARSATVAGRVGVGHAFGMNPNGSGLRAAPTVRRPSRDPIAPSRGDCKACGLAITGKSVSSADGRLTGKYHKACFVCTACQESFTSAEFYVLKDKPYCKRDYHKLNGSLCGTCHKGIEGQFLEDETRLKHHVTCFRCLDCGQSLSEGYFEVEGKSYCERHALKRVQDLNEEEYEPSPPKPAFGSSPNARRSPRQQPASPPRLQMQQQQQQQQWRQQEQPPVISPLSPYPPPPPPPKDEQEYMMPPRIPESMSRRPSNSRLSPRPGAGARMERGRGGYGVEPGTRAQMNKRMTRIGMM